MQSFFSAERLTMRFGGLVAVDAFDLELARGEIVGIIGPNGAGKTTIFNMIAGYYTPSSGSITFRGEELIGKKANQITKLGIARTFQNIRLFSELKVIENVMLGFHCRLRSSFWGALFHSPLYLREEKAAYEGALEILEKVELDRVGGEKASSLPYGMQRKLEIARALATSPRLLLLDEPAAGMNPNETQELLELILKLKNDYDLTILLIEHDMKFIMRICERLKVLDYGITIAEGDPEQVQNDPKVIRAYLGEM